MISWTINSYSQGRLRDLCKESLIPVVAEDWRKQSSRSYSYSIIELVLRLRNILKILKLINGIQGSSTSTSGNKKTKQQSINYCNKQCHNCFILEYYSWTLTVLLECTGMLCHLSKFDWFLEASETLLELPMHWFDRLFTKG